MKNIEQLKSAALNSDNQIDIDLFAEVLIKTFINICDWTVLENEITLENSELNILEQGVIRGGSEQAKNLSRVVKEYFGIE